MLRTRECVDEGCRRSRSWHILAHLRYDSFCSNRNLLDMYSVMDTMYLRDPVICASISRAELRIDGMHFPPHPPATVLRTSHMLLTLAFPSRECRWWFWEIPDHYHMGPITTTWATTDGNSIDLITTADDTQHTLLTLTLPSWECQRYSCGAPIQVSPFTVFFSSSFSLLYVTV